MAPGERLSQLLTLQLDSQSYSLGPGIVSSKSATTMSILKKQLNKLTLLSVVAYVFIFSICAKGMVFYFGQHPAKEILLSVKGTTKEVKLGGNGNSTKLRIKSEHGTNLYSSYYGKVWPGMERIQVGDGVEILAERNRLKKNERVSGKSYYIWELKHQDQIIVKYDDVLELVQGKEATINNYINIWLVVSFVFLVMASLPKLILRFKGC